jgi:sortase A
VKRIQGTGGAEGWSKRACDGEGRSGVSIFAPVTVRHVLRGIGKTLIGAGILIFLFVAYQLWGTGIAERRAQHSLKAQFDKSLSTTPTTAPVTTLPPDFGQAVALITIPKISVDKYVVEGVGVEDLKRGPGHYPGTPMPGEPGNAAIAGHRTTYGAPFYNLNDLGIGDPIMVTTRAGKFRYEVFDSKVVSPSEASVLDPTPDNRLTLTTCNPRFSAAQRLIVMARLVSPVVEEPAPAPGPAPRRAQRIGLSGATAPKTPAILWGALAALVLVGTWLLGRVWKRWPAYLVGAPVFLVVLFFFFENFSRLLPANV